MKKFWKAYKRLCIGGDLWVPYALGYLTGLTLILLEQASKNNESKED